MKYLIIITTSLSLLACFSKTKILADKSHKTYKIDKNTCIEKEMPITSFAFNYPATTILSDELDNKNNYVKLSKEDKGVLIESITIGYSQLIEDNEKYAFDIIKVLGKHFKNQISDLIITYTGKKKFKEDFVYVIESSSAKEINISLDQKGNRKYNMFIIIKIPRNNDQVNGVMFCCITNEKIKSLEDLNNLEISSTVFNSFSFNMD